MPITNKKASSRAAGSHDNDAEAKATLTKKEPVKSKRRSVAFANTTNNNNNNTIKVTLKKAASDNYETIDCPIVTINPMSVGDIAATTAKTLDEAYQKNEDANSPAVYLRIQRAKTELRAIMNNTAKIRIEESVARYINDIVQEKIYNNGSLSEIKNSYIFDAENTWVSPTATFLQNTPNVKQAGSDTSISPDSTVNKTNFLVDDIIKTPGYQANVQFIGAFAALSDLQLRESLGEKQYIIYQALMQQKLALSEDLNATSSKLKDWRERHADKKSMVRAGLGVLSAGVSQARDIYEWQSWRNGYSPTQANIIDASAAEFDKYAGDPLAAFNETADNPELYTTASEHEVIAHTEQAIKAIEDACIIILSGRSITPKNVDITADPILASLAEFSVSNDKYLANEKIYANRVVFLQQTAKAGRVGDALLAYQSLAQAYLNLPSANKESFNYTKDGKGSLTLAINTVLRRHDLNGHKVALSITDLVSPQVRCLIIDYWGEIKAVYQSQITGEPERKAEKFVAFDTELYSKEIGRLKDIEESASHTKLHDILNNQTINAIFANIKDAEPSYIKKFGDGVLSFIDSPQLWGMVGVGTLTSGVASGLVLGSRAVTVGELINYARTGSLSVEAIGMCAATVSIDGIAFHAGMNIFNEVIGEYEQINNSEWSYIKTILMMGAIQLATSAHFSRVQNNAIKRQMRAAEQNKNILVPATNSVPAHLIKAEPSRWVKIGNFVDDAASNTIEAGRYFSEEALCLSAVETIEMLGKDQDVSSLSLALEQTMQFLLAMRLAHGVQRVTGLQVQQKRNVQRYKPRPDEVTALEDLFIAINNWRVDPTSDGFGRVLSRLRAYFNTLEWEQVPTQPETKTAASKKAQTPPVVEPEVSLIPIEQRIEETHYNLDEVNRHIRELLDDTLEITLQMWQKDVFVPRESINSLLTLLTERQQELRELADTVKLLRTNNNAKNITEMQNLLLDYDVATENMARAERLVRLQHEIMELLVDVDIGNMLVEKLQQSCEENTENTVMELDKIYNSTIAARVRILNQIDAFDANTGTEQTSNLIRRCLSDFGELVDDPILDFIGMAQGLRKSQTIAVENSDVIDIKNTVSTKENAVTASIPEKSLAEYRKTVEIAIKQANNANDYLDKQVTELAQRSDFEYLEEEVYDKAEEDFAIVTELYQESSDSYKMAGSAQAVDVEIPVGFDIAEAKFKNTLSTARAQQRSVNVALNVRVGRRYCGYLKIVTERWGEYPQDKEVVWQSMRSILESTQQQLEEDVSHLEVWIGDYDNSSPAASSLLPIVKNRIKTAKSQIDNIQNVLSRNRIAPDQEYDNSFGDIDQLFAAVQNDDLRSVSLAQPIDEHLMLVKKGTEEARFLRDRMRNYLQNVVDGKVDILSREGFERYKINVLAYYGRLSEIKKYYQNELPEITEGHENGLLYKEFNIVLKYSESIMTMMNVVGLRQQLLNIQEDIGEIFHNTNGHFNKDIDFSLLEPGLLPTEVLYNLQRRRFEISSQVLIVKRELQNLDSRYIDTYKELIDASNQTFIENEQLLGALDEYIVDKQLMPNKVSRLSEVWRAPYMVKEVIEDMLHDCQLLCDKANYVESENAKREYLKQGRKKLENIKDAMENYGVMGAREKYNHMSMVLYEKYTSMQGALNKIGIQIGP